MGKGKRYNGEQKLNMKKVWAVIIAVAVMIMFIVVIMNLLKEKPNAKDKTYAIAYYAVYENEKWGVINTKGETIIEPQYQEMIVIPDHTKPIFICVTDVNYETGAFLSKAINEKNESLYTSYDKIEIFYNHDENNNLWYEEKVLKVQKDGKYGMINLEGKEIVPCTYDTIEPLTGTAKSFEITKEGKKGVVDNTGSIIIEPTYKEIKPLTAKYENGYIVLNDEGKQGIIGYNKKTILEPKYEEIKPMYGNGYYVVKENGTWKIIDEEKQTYLDNGFEEVKQIVNGDQIILKKAGKYGVFNKAGEEKIPAEYENITYAYTDTYIAKKDGKYGMLTIANETKLNFDYVNITYIEDADFIQAQVNDIETKLLDRNFAVKATGVVSEINKEKNYIKVREGGDYKYYNFKLEEKKNTELLTGNTLFLSKKDGKYGYVDAKGNVKVNYQYDDATEQNKYGFVSVKKDGKWGSLDQNGRVVIEPTYSLENNFVIDFIGSWHLAEDINANYYTK